MIWIRFLSSPGSTGIYHCAIVKWLFSATTCSRSFPRGTGSRKSIRIRTGVKTRETIPFIVHTARVFGIHRKIAREISFETEAGAYELKNSMMKHSRTERNVSDNSGMNGNVAACLSIRKIISFVVTLSAHLNRNLYKSAVSFFSNTLLRLSYKTYSFSYKQFFVTFNYFYAKMRTFARVSKISENAELMRDDIKYYKNINPESFASFFDLLIDSIVYSRDLPVGDCFRRISISLLSIVKLDFHFYSESHKTITCHRAGNTIQIRV